MFPKYSRICFYCLYLRTVVGKASCSRPPQGIPPLEVQEAVQEPAKEETMEEVKEEVPLPMGSKLISQNHHD